MPDRVSAWLDYVLMTTIYSIWCAEGEKASASSVQFVIFSATQHFSACRSNLRRLQLRVWDVPVQSIINISSMPCRRGPLV